MSIESDLKKDGITVIEPLDTTTVNVIAKNVSKKIVAAFSNLGFDFDTLYERFSKLPMYIADMPEGMSEMSRFSKVSSIFGRDAFATMRYVTLLNVSEIRDISNDERKVPFKNDEYLASGTSSFRKACKSIIRDNKI